VLQFIPWYTNFANFLTNCSKGYRTFKSIIFSTMKTKLITIILIGGFLGLCFQTANSLQAFSSSISSLVPAPPVGCDCENRLNEIVYPCCHLYTEIHNGGVLFKLCMEVEGCDPGTSTEGCDCSDECSVPHHDVPCSDPS